MTPNEILDMMRKGMGQVPAAIEKSVPVDSALIQEHMRSKGFAMPVENPALDEETRTLIYLSSGAGRHQPGVCQGHVQQDCPAGHCRQQGDRDRAHRAPGHGHQDHW